jgi:ankyrin repeat protein
MMCPEIASRKSDGDDRTPQETIDAIHRPKWCVESDDGRLYWDLICAAIRNDVESIAEHLKKDPNCARLEYWYTPPIHFAVREGNLEATQLLWNAYAYEDVSDLITMADDRGLADVAEFLRNSINNESPDADLRLHNAVQTRNYGAIGRLLRTDPRIADHRDAKGRTALHIAVIADNLRAVRSLLDAGVGIDPVDHYGFRPVHYACWRNQYWSFGEGGVALLKVLLDAGAADSPTLAAARGDLNALRAVVEANPAAVNDGETLQKRPLSAAVERSHREIVRYLLDNGGDPSLPESRLCPHGSALITASVNDDVEITRWLLDAGADPNGEVDSSGTPATRASSDAMRGLLYEYGGRPEAAWGIAQRGDLETLAAILRYCDDPFSNEDSEFLTTPYTAIVSGCGRCLDKRKSTDAHEAMLRIFLKRRFPMPVVLTACKGYLYHVPHMTRQLLESGLNPNLHDWQRRTPLHDLCAGLRHVEDPAGLIQMFIQHGAEVNAIDEEDRSTPLGIAAREGDLRLVKLLLDNGADPNTAGADWAMPLAWAERRGHDKVAALLREHGGV